MRDRPVQDRAGQLFLVEGEALLVLGRSTHPNFGPYVPAWTLLYLDTLERTILSEDWVAAQEAMGARVRR